MVIVFDTNIIHDDFNLLGPRISKLTSAAEKLGYELMVPEVVIDEFVNQYRKKLLQYMPGYSGVLKMVSRSKGVEEVFDRDAYMKERVKDFAAFLRKRLATLNIKVIEYPQIEIKTLVYKDLEVRKPFKEKKDGNIGYRDALILESIKSICRSPIALVENPQIVFLTENTKDFAGPDNALHQDLVEELITVGLAENCVSLVPNVKEFFETRIDTELEELEQIKTALLKTGKFYRFELTDEVERVLSHDYVTEVLTESDFDSGQRYYLRESIEDPTISDVIVTSIVIMSVKRLSNQTVLIEVQASVIVDMDFFVYKPDYYLLDEDRLPVILDAEWNDHYMWCEGNANMSFLLAFITTPKLGRIMSVNVQVLDVKI